MHGDGAREGLGAAAAGAVAAGPAVVAVLAVDGALVGVAARCLTGGRAVGAAVLGPLGDGAREGLGAAAARPAAAGPAVVAVRAVLAGCGGEGNGFGVGGGTWKQFSETRSSKGGG